MLGIKPSSARDDVGRQLRQRAALGERPRAQPAKRLLNPHPELNRNHAGRLVDFGTTVGQRITRRVALLGVDASLLIE